MGRLSQHCNHTQEGWGRIYPNTCGIYPKSTHQCYLNTSLTQALTPPKSTSSCKDMPQLFKNALRIHFASARQDQREPFYISSWHPSRVGKQKFSGKMGREMGQESQVSPAGSVEAVGGRASVPRSPAVSLGIPQVRWSRAAVVCHSALAHKSSSTARGSSTSPSAGWVTGAGGNHIFLWQLHSSCAWEGDPLWEYPQKN